MEIHCWINQKQNFRTAYKKVKSTFQKLMTVNVWMKVWKYRKLYPGKGKNLADLRF